MDNICGVDNKCGEDSKSELINKLVSGVGARREPIFEILHFFEKACLACADQEDNQFSIFYIFLKKLVSRVRIKKRTHF